DDRVKKHADLLSDAVNLRNKLRDPVPSDNLYAHLPQFTDQELVVHQQGGEPAGPDVFASAEHAIGEMILRPAAYHAKYASQELSLLF
ncbi:unnamed protein product, partial [Amoebophrya sp. A25]